MAQPIARDAQDFARLMLRTVERLGQGGEWVPAREVFERTVAEQPDHPYLAHIAAKPGRRIGLSATLERLRAAEFPTIERRKDGSRRNAPVLYRVRPAPVALDLQLPQEAPTSHPLVTRRRATEARGERATSARRAALTEREARSPWRRRLLPRVPRAPQGVGNAGRALRNWWRCGLLPRVTGASRGVESAVCGLRSRWRYGVLPRVTGVSRGIGNAVRSLPRGWRQLRALGLSLATGLAKR